MRHRPTLTPRLPFSVVLAALLAGQAGAACDTPFYPVREGFSRTYQTAIQGKPTTYTETIRKVTPGGFTYGNSMVPNVTSTMTCDSTGITGMTGMNIPGMKITEMHGRTFPAAMNVGTAWTYGYTLKGNVQGQDMIQNMDITSKVVGRERVRVKAGTFDALKVEQHMAGRMLVNGQKMPQPAINATLWLVKGIGMVKSTAAGVTVELLRYSK